MARVGNLTADLTLETATFNRNLDRAQRNLNSGASKINRNLARIERFGERMGRNMGRSLTGLIRNFTGLHAIIGTVAGTAGLGLLVKRSLDAADNIGKVADRVGFTTDQLQELRFAAEQTGVAQNTLDMALQRFSRRVGEVSQGQGELLKTAQQYNIAIRDSDGQMRSNIELFRDFANVIKNAESEQEQLRIAFKLFDSEGAALVNLMRQGADGVDLFRRRAADLGLIIEEDLVRNAERASDQFNILTGVLSTKVTRAVVNLAPQLTSLLDGIIDKLPVVIRHMENLAHAIGLVDQVSRNTQLANLTEQIAETRMELEAARETVVDLPSGVTDFLGSLGLSDKDPGMKRILDLEERLKRLLRTRERLMNAMSFDPAGGSSSDPKKSPLVRSTLVQADAVGELTGKIVKMGKARRDARMLEEETLQGLKDENLLLRLTTQGRTKEVAAIERTNEAFDILTRLKTENKFVNDDILADILRELDARDKLTAQIEEQAEVAKLLEKNRAEQKRIAERQATEIAEIFRGAANDIESGFNEAIFQIFRGSKNRDLVGDFLDFVQDGFARLLANLATMALVRPIVVPIVGSIAGGLGLAGAGAGLVDSSFGLGNLASAGSTLAGAVFPGGDFSLFGAGGLLDVQGILSTPLTGSVVGPLGPTLPGITLGGALGAGALGAAGGALLGPLLGLNQVGASIGGGLGAAGGAILGSIVPGVGTLLGGVLGGLGGGLLGGLFGGKPSVGPLARANISFSGGRLSLGTTAEDNGGNVQQAVQAAQVAIQQVNSLIDSLGLTLTRAANVSAFIGGDRATRSIRSRGILTGSTPEELLNILLSPQFLSSSDPLINSLIAQRNVGGLQALPGIRQTAFAQSLAAGQSIQGFLNQQALSDVSTLSPTQRLSEAQRQFQELLTRVRGGDLSATGGLTQAAGSLLNIGRENFASTVNFANLERFVRSNLREVGAQVTSEDFVQDRVVEAVRQLGRSNVAQTDETQRLLRDIHRQLRDMTDAIRAAS